MQYPHGRILVFCKAPLPGQVKTRLAEAIGQEAATTIHVHLACHCLRVAVNAQLAPVTLFCAPDVDHEFFQACRKEWGVCLQSQHGRDLGERMQHAVEESLQQSSPVLVIGTDCPAITADYLRTAMVFASKGDTVIGPAEDGGYVLLAMKEPRSELFTDIDWGTSQVYAQTLARISGKVNKLDDLWDVDRLVDVRRLREDADQLGLDDGFQVCLQALDIG
ncbi:MAG TPA: glycosyltransferase [Gammaproteobacteria bacterium]|nr:glycosyltransferase [Gammaproteobacteria bacterium]